MTSPVAGLIISSFISRASFFFFHGLANQGGVAGFGIDHGFRGHTTAGHRVGIFLCGDNTVFDQLGGGRRLLAPYGGGGGRDRRLFRGATGQKQAKREYSFPHALCFRSVAAACRWQSWLQAPASAKGGFSIRPDRQALMHATSQRGMMLVWAGR
jgi:hypothetical protein